MGKGLTVIAMANDAVDHPGRHIRDDADNLPTTAAYLHFLGHLSPSQSGDAIQCSPGWLRLTSGPEHMAAVLREYFRQLMYLRACSGAAGSHFLHDDGTAGRADHV